MYILYIDYIWNEVYKLCVPYVCRNKLVGREMPKHEPMATLSRSDGVRTYTATEARKEFSTIVDKAFFGERVVIRKHNREVALVSIELLELFDAMMKAEAALEAEQASAALEEFHAEGGKAMEDLERDLEID